MVVGVRNVYKPVYGEACADEFEQVVEKGIRFIHGISYEMAPHGQQK